MCPECKLRCEKPSTDSGAFCNGERLSMYMDGFSFSLKNPDKGCLILFTNPFVLNSYPKYVAGMFASFMLAFLLEGIPVLRHKYCTERPAAKWIHILLVVGKAVVRAVLAF